MEALQRSVLSNNWITIIFLVSLAVLFFLKLFEAEKLKGYAASIFNKGFIEIEAEDNSSFFSFFHTVHRHHRRWQAAFENKLTQRN